MKVPQLPNYAKKIKRNIYKKMKNNITKYYHIIIEENNISEAYIFYNIMVSNFDTTEKPSERFLSKPKNVITFKKYEGPPIQLYRGSPPLNVNM